MSDLYRLVYASRNLLEANEAEATAAIAQILETSRRNNAKVGVTGALLFNGGAFAQVLEGPRRAVESTFERIQRDERHGEVTVLQCGPVESRGFANWSMGFVGRSARGQTLWSGLARESGFDLSRLDGDAVFAMLHSLVLDDESVSTAAGGHPVADAPRHQAVPALDVERVRAELPRPGQAPRAPQPADADGRQVGPTAPHDRIAGGIEGSPSALALAVLKDALAAERRRTTDLRDTLDAMQVALATSQERADQLLRERDLWARRSQLLATALGQEASSATMDVATASGSEPSPATVAADTRPRSRAA